MRIYPSRGSVIATCKRCRGRESYRADEDPTESLIKVAIAAGAKTPDFLTEAPMLEMMGRCWACGYGVVKLNAFLGRVERKCPSCKMPNLFTGTSLDDTVGRKLYQRLTMTRTFDRLMGQLELRWLAIQANHARMRAEVAVGRRFDVFLRDGFRCAYCGRSVDEGAMLHVDHIVPRARGGEDTLDNLTTACRECNIGKSAKPI